MKILDWFFKKPKQKLDPRINKKKVIALIKKSVKQQKEGGKMLEAMRKAAEK